MSTEPVKNDAPVTPPPAAAPTKPPTLTSANLPSSTPNSVTTSPSQQHEMLSDDQIVAKPLIDPDFTNLKPKNPNYVFRWVNRVAGSGARFEKMKASGFRVANYNDVAGEIPSHFKKDNAIINGDLILTIIDRKSYVGALKHNQEKAHKRLHKGFSMRTGQEQLKQALNEVPGSAANKAKVKLYEPGL